jgi:predicted P-loop ATPase
MNIVKSLITSTDVNERAAYGRLKERRVRLASFCASTNNREFLTDVTGNRRWLPFEVESIQNPFNTLIPYSMLYAQAKAMVESGYFSYWFEPEEIVVLEKHNEEYRVQEGEEQLLMLLFDVPAEGRGKFMTTAEISERLVSYGNIKRPTSLRQLGHILSNKGYKPHRTTLDGIRQRGWMVYERNSDELKALKNMLKGDGQRDNGTMEF